MGLIARIKDRLFDRRNVIEVEYLEEGGQPLSLESLKNTTLYRHVVSLNYVDEVQAPHTTSMVIIDNHKSQYTIDDIVDEEYSPTSKLNEIFAKALIIGSLSHKPFLAKCYEIASTFNEGSFVYDLVAIIPTLEDSNYVLKRQKVIEDYNSKLTSVTDTVTKL